MLYHVTHTTTYRYSEAVSLCHNLAHLTPRETPEQRCLRTSVAVDPEPAVVAERVDFFGNPETFFAVQQPHRSLTLTAAHVVEVIGRPEPEPARSPPWEQLREQLAAPAGRVALDAFQFAAASRYAGPTEELLHYAEPSFPAGRPLLEGALDLMGRIYREFRYDPRATTLSTPLHEVLARRRGVCQDFAHLQIACLRSLGLAARYVSGYIRTLPPAGQPRLVGADATHAWLSVYCPGQGWVDLDPTNDRVPRDEYILLAWGRDYDDVSPVKGVILGGGRHEMTVAVDVLTE